MNGRVLTAEEHSRIAAAIRTAEARTSGEIICVLARRSDSYFYPAAFAVMVALLLASLIAAFVIDRLWIAVPLWHFAAAQVLSLAASLALLGWLPSLRIRLVPKSLRYRRAHRNAVSQFLARNIHVTESRIGVLIFLSLAEHHAEIVADAGINAHVSQDKWNAIVGDLIAHAARGEIAAGFAGSFAPAGGGANELEDHLVEI